MIQRNITPNLSAALADTPVVLLNGARQTGKSTLVKAIASRNHISRYISLDDLSALSSVRHDPSGFLGGLEGPVIIDEVQKAPDLFVAIKKEVDLDRKPGRFLLTGSANVFLLPRLSESLAGRMEILTLWPFSQGELSGIQERFIDALFEEKTSFRGTGGEDSGEVLDKVIAGGYPEVLRRSPARRRAWFGSYIMTILQRDVRDLAHIEGVSHLPKLLSLLAVRVPAFLNFAEFSRTTAIPQRTLKRYMALLETTFLIQNIPAWSAHLGKRLVKAPKLFMNDTGLKAHLLGISSGSMLMEGMSGPLLENFVIMELRKQISWSSTQAQMFHFRTQTGQEVDLILEDPQGRLVGIEVKAGKTIGAQDFKGLRAFAEMTGKRFRRGVVLYTGKEVIPFGSNLHAVPVNVLWQLGKKS